MSAVLFLELCLGLTWMQAAVLPPQFTTPESSPFVATEGKTPLVWDVPGNTNLVRFELQQSLTETFEEARVRYQGLDRATYVAGLPAGDFYYRVRIAPENKEPSPWSNAMHVRVEYVSLKFVFGLTILGLFVFAATVMVVVTGHRRAIRAEAVKP